MSFVKKALARSEANEIILMEDLHDQLVNNFPRMLYNQIAQW